MIFELDRLVRPIRDQISRTGTVYDGFFNPIVCGGEMHDAIVIRARAIESNRFNVFAVNDKSFSHTYEYPSCCDIGGVYDTVLYSRRQRDYTQWQIHPLESCKTSCPLITMAASGAGGGEGGKFAGGGDGDGGGGGGDGPGGGFGGSGGGLGGGGGGDGDDGGGGKDRKSISISMT